MSKCYSIIVTCVHIKGKVLQPMVSGKHVQDSEGEESRAAATTKEASCSMHLVLSDG